MRAVLSFEYGPCWASRLVKDFGLRVRLLSEKARQVDIQDDALLWGKDRKSVEGGLAFLGKHPHISQFKVVERSSDGLMLRLRVNVRRQICPLWGALQLQWPVTEQPPILERVDYRGRTSWSMDSRRARRVAGMLGERFGVRRVAKKIRPDKDGMRKSTFLLKEAYERGYFDVPKGTSLRRVAHEIGVPVSTLSTDIRRAVNDIVDKATR